MSSKNRIKLYNNCFWTTVGMDLKAGQVCTEGCMVEHASLEFDVTFCDVLLHKLVKTFQSNVKTYFIYVTELNE